MQHYQYQHNEWQEQQQQQPPPPPLPPPPLPPLGAFPPFHPFPSSTEIPQSAPPPIPPPPPALSVSLPPSPATLPLLAAAAPPPRPRRPNYSISQTPTSATSPTQNNSPIHSTSHNAYSITVSPVASPPLSLSESRSSQVQPAISISSSPPPPPPPPLPPPPPAIYLSAVIKATTESLSAQSQPTFSAPNPTTVPTVSNNSFYNHQADFNAYSSPPPLPAPVSSSSSSSSPASTGPSVSSSNNVTGVGGFSSTGSIGGAPSAAKAQLLRELAEARAAAAERERIKQQEKERQQKEKEKLQAEDDLAARKAKRLALDAEIRSIILAIENERERQAAIQAEREMAAQQLLVKMQQEKLDQERQVRLLAAKTDRLILEIAEKERERELNLNQNAYEKEQKELAAKQAEDLAELASQRKELERQLAVAAATDSDEEQLKNFVIDECKPLRFGGSPHVPWLEPEAAIRHRMTLDSDFNIIAQPDHRRVRLKSQPFAKGGMRLAIFAEDITDLSHPFRLVMKESIYQGPRANSLSTFYNDVRSQLVARRFAERFNRLRPPKFVNFLLPMIYEFPYRSDNDRRYMAAEMYMEGYYIKYSDNFKYVNTQFRTIPAFCHWSWQDSQGAMMITDLQGVNYILTDPQVHSTHPSAEFGAGGGDARAMDDFFADHQCNEICQLLKLKPHPLQPRGIIDDGVTRAGTQYATEVIGACGHIFILQVKDRLAYLESKGKMICPDCKKMGDKAVFFFPKEK